MDWDDLRVFLAVARTESLSGAGKTLRCDAATVGRRITRLEEALKSRLFLRSPQGYQLTDAGQRLLPHAEAAESAMTAAGEDLGGSAGQISGQLRIGAPDGCANYVLPQVCAALSDRHPDLDIQIVALPRVFNLSRREADLVIGVSPPTAGRLTVQKLTDYHLHLAAHRDYLARHPPIRSAADLSAHRIIGYIPDMIFDKELDYLGETGAGAVRLGSNSVSVQMQMVRARAGIGVVHDFAIPGAAGVVKVLPGEISLKRSFWLIRHADDRRSDRMNRLAEALTEGMRREVARLEALT
ncbi:LysR family transcriptional regulator [Falsigemmobacter faecalis]|uniref:LysR family transcriptional regulator n=1 Tax=Falsigemmobacter faecalis TaxID=2488730 RepID=A0A3P3DM67_9RHOB|nr:LysR family transcriptional regulator [Falsigemmobacter faecalis]RRH74806.1 LysR family transcriptional regulator [Falsigemmobacter faecalis]